MAKGDIYPSETSSYKDRETGARVHRLTNYLCHSNHPYFTHWGFYGDLKWMLFHSDRENAHNLFGLNLEDGQIRQLTDFPAVEGSPSPFSAVVSRVRDEAYFWVDNRLYRMDLLSLDEKLLWESPTGMRTGTPNCAADGTALCFTLNEDLSARLPVDPLRGYVGFDDMWKAKPLCQIWRVPADGSAAQMIWEEKTWIGHVNCSPTDPDILTFCHEGPWEKVDNRIWGLDTSAGKAWKIRAASDESFVGHEYWFEDGSRVGYHGAISGAGPFWGHADPFGGDWIDYDNSPGSMHFQSLDDTLIVGDGGAAFPHIMLWRRNGDQLEHSILCTHGGSFRTQRVHVHPAIMPDRKSVIFTADMGEYGQIYRVELPSQ